MYRKLIVTLSTLKKLNIFDCIMKRYLLCLVLCQILYDQFVDYDTLEVCYTLLPYILGSRQTGVSTMPSSPLLTDVVLLYP